MRGGHLSAARPGRRTAPGLLTLLILLILVLVALFPARAGAQAPGWRFAAGSVVHAAAVSADGEYIALGTREGLVLYLNRRGEEVWRYDTGGTVLGLGMSEDGQRIIAATESRSALLLDGAGQLLWKKDFDFALVAAAMSGDGSLIGLVPRKSRLVWILDGAGNDVWQHEFDTPPTAVAISADGQRVVFGSRDARIRAFDPQGRQLWEQQVDGVITRVALTRDGGLVAVSDESGKGYLLRGDDGTVLWSYEAEGVMETAAISGDGQQVAFGARDKHYYLLDQKGTLLSRSPTSDVVHAVALSGDGSTLVVGSDDGTVLGFSVRQTAAGYAAQVQAARIRTIFITVIAIALLAGLIAFLRLTPSGRRAWEVHGARPRRLAREVWRARGSYLLLLPTVGLLLTFNYYPALSGLFHSFTKWNPGIETRWIGLENFQALLYNQFLRRGIVNAIILIVTGYIKVLTVPLLVAELLFHLRSRPLQYWLRSLFIFPIVVPGVAIILIWRNIFDPNIGLLNNTLALLGLMNMQQPQAWLGDPKTAIWSIVFIGFPWVSAFALLLYYGGLISIPVELFDAAKVDGAGSLRRFWNLDLPLLLGQIKLLLILGFINGMQEFAIVFLTTEGGPYNATYTPALELYYQAMRFSNFGLASAIGTVLFIIILGGTILNLRYVRSATEYQA
jgi:ABC-type sugar transport system permease subunit/outer membrane protein assembly factor BamB